MIVINLIGLLVAAISLGVGIGVADKLGSHGHGLAMMIAGPMMVVLDVGYRRFRGLKLVGWRGPAIFWLPAWLWGLLWFGAGVTYVVRGV
jgi:TM2 domain-containing membrane protein YozV